MTDAMNAIQTARLLAALVDTLVPEDADWPGAATVGVQSTLASRLVQERGEDAVSTLVAALQPGAAALLSDTEAARVAAVTAWEASDRGLFGWVRDAVYLAYYENPVVVQAIRAHGFTYKVIPHLTGYRVPRFDPARDTPRHGRGGWTPTESVERVAVESLGLADQHPAGLEHG